jgi:uncharacterized protein (TIGR00251 family)
MIAVSAHAQGSILPVRAKPGAKVNAVVDTFENALLVAVTARPEDGKANEAIVRVLAEVLGCRRSEITLVSGQTSRNKRFLIEGIGAQDLLDRIDAALTPTIFESMDPEL